MKLRFFLLFAAAALFAACTPKTPSVSEALAAYEQQIAELDSFFQTCDSEEEAEAAMDSFLSSSMELALQYPGTEVPLVVMRNTIWYLSFEQKQALFDAICLDSLAEKDLRYYNAFQAETATAVGQQYVDFGALTPAGDSLYLHQLVGTKPYLLVDFWATWCGPCRASMPALKELYTEFADRLEILGVSLDAEQDKWTTFVADPATALPWKHVSDLQGWSCAPAALYGVNSIPATVLINAEGVIVARNIEPDALRELLLK